MTSKTTRFIHTDGCCKGNPGPGGWGWWSTLGGNPEATGCGGTAEQTTNSRMEQTAVLRALEALPSEDADRPVVLRSDSQFVIEGLRSWLPGWKKRGWTKSDGAPVANADLWKLIDEQLQRRTASTRFEHVMRAVNHYADKLANEGVAQALAATSSPLA